MRCKKVTQRLKIRVKTVRKDSQPKLNRRTISKIDQCLPNFLRLRGTIRHENIFFRTTKSLHNIPGATEQKLVLQNQ